MSFFDDFMPLRIKKNWQIVRADPKKWVDFNLKVIQIVIGVITILIVWQFIQVIIGFNTGNSAMSMIGRLITFLFMCIIIYKIYNNGYLPLKARMLHYQKQNPNINKIPEMTDKEIEEAIDKTFKHFKNKQKEVIK